MRRVQLVAIAAAFVAALASVWLLVGVIPAVRGEAARVQADHEQRQRMSDAVAAHSLARAVFTRDYGEAQELLDRYAEIGYATRALVVNTERIVVASVGAFPDLKIGSRMPDILATGGRSVRLTLRSEVYGELRIVAPAAPSDADAGRPARDALWVVAIVLLVASSAAFAALVAARALHR